MVQQDEMTFRESDERWLEQGMQSWKMPPHQVGLKGCGL